MLQGFRFLPLLLTAQPVKITHFFPQNVRQSTHATHCSNSTTSEQKSCGTSKDVEIAVLRLVDDSSYASYLRNGNVGGSFGTAIRTGFRTRVTPRQLTSPPLSFKPMMLEC